MAIQLKDLMQMTNEEIAAREPKVKCIRCHKTVPVSVAQEFGGMHANCFDEAMDETIGSHPIGLPRRR